jgi:micrococcal nuclease
MISFKQQEAVQEDLTPRWKIGVDKNQVALFIAGALILGFALGFLTARLIQKNDDPNAAEQKRIEEAQRPRPSEAKVASGVYAVKGIIKADTLEVDQLGPVRMIGIETPDGNANSTYKIPGQEARAYTEKYLLNSEVKIEFDPVYAPNGNRDANGQLSAYIYTKDDLLFNAELLKQGYAFVRTSEKFKLAEDFNAFEREALMAMRGVWGNSTTASNTPPPTNPDASTEPGSPSKRPRSTALDPSAIGPNINPLPGGGVTAPAPSTNPGEPTVLVSADRMYHKAGCEFIGKKGRAMSLSEARSSGYSACSRCFPSTGIKQ